MDSLKFNDKGVHLVHLDIRSLLFWYNVIKKVGGLCMYINKKKLNSLTLVNKRW